MATVALVVSILAMAAAVWSAISAHRSSKAATQTAALDEDRRFEEKEPQLHVDAHRHAILKYRDGKRAQESYQAGFMLENGGPQPYTIAITYADPDPIENAIRDDWPTGFHQRHDVEVSSSLDIGLLGVGQRTFVRAAGFRFDRTITLLFTCTNEDGEQWTKRHRLYLPSLADGRQWPSRSKESVAIDAEN